MITHLLISATIAAAAAGSQAGGSVREGTGPGTAVEEAGPLTLPDALLMALKRSPVLTAFTWDIRAADAMIIQAGLRPNPELSVEIEELRWTPGPSDRTRTNTLSGIPGLSVAGERERGEGKHSGFSESEFTISIAQPILLGGKRAKRVAAVEREKELVLWDYQAARADVLARTALDFVQVLAAQEHISLESELTALAEEVVRTFSLRVEAGQVSPLELLRAEAALATTRITYQESLSELEAARAVLASNWGGKRPAFTKAAGRLDEIRPVPALEELEARTGRNPDLARWPAEFAAARADFALERTQRIPDLRLELGFRSTGLAGRKSESYGFGTGGGFGFTRSESSNSRDRDNSLVLGFSVPLPLFDRNQGGIAAAEARTSKVSDRRRAVEAAVHGALASAHQTASGAYVKAQALQDEVMPIIEETFEKIQRGYQQGKFSYLEVLDTQRTLFDAREAFLGALTRYHQGVVRMERLTGQALEEHGLKAEMEARSHEE